MTDETMAIEVTGCDSTGRHRFNLVIDGAVWSKRALITKQTAEKLVDNRAAYDSFMDTVIESIREELWEDLQKKYRGAK